MSPVDQFRSALVQRGIVPPDELRADGKMHRCDVEGKSGKRGAAYVLHLDAEAGGFQNHTDGHGWQEWRCDLNRDISPAQLAEYRGRLDVVRP